MSYECTYENTYMSSYICIHTYTQTCTRQCTDKHMYMNTYIFINKKRDIHTYIHIHMPTKTITCICMYVCMYVCMYIIYIYIYIYIWTPRLQTLADSNNQDSPQQCGPWSKPLKWAAGCWAVLVRKRMHAYKHICMRLPCPHLYKCACMYEPTYPSVHHHQLLGPDFTQVLHNLHVPSSTGQYEACADTLQTLAVRPPTCAASSLRVALFALLVKKHTPAPEPQWFRVVCMWMLHAWHVAW